MKVAVRKHVLNVERNIYGKVIARNYYYTIAVKKWLTWQHLKFYFRGRDPGAIINTSTTIPINKFGRALWATFFKNEADAIKVKQDILQNPDKYRLS